MVNVMHGRKEWSDSNNRRKIRRYAKRKETRESRGASRYNGRRILCTCNNASSKDLLYKATDRLSKWYVSGTHQEILPFAFVRILFPAAQRFCHIFDGDGQSLYELDNSIVQNAIITVKRDCMKRVTSITNKYYSSIFLFNFIPNF